MKLADLRQAYHRRICAEIIRINHDSSKGYPNFADVGNKASIHLAWGIVNRLGHNLGIEIITGQTSGGRFEEITRDFLEKVFKHLQHLRPGTWYYYSHLPISYFDQYAHLAYLEQLIKNNKELASSLGKDYIIKPDILIGRSPVIDNEINHQEDLISTEEIYAQLTPFRIANSSNAHPILHASISCKWTLRSDRGQNARTEALNLIRNRKGHVPHIVAVTAEPLPTRIASLALGTGDLDCVYHFALFELKEAIAEAQNEDQLDMLNMLIEGRRLRDISDLPFDLAT